MAEQVQITNLNDGRARVVYDMALSMWRNENDKAFPKASDSVEFLKLVDRCNRAFNNTVAFLDE